jgi:hypothetical protein
MERRFMNGRFIRAAAGAMTDGRFINLVQGTLSVQGGTFIYNYDSLTATDSVFTANHATQGGAVDQEWYATLTGDLFTRNTATPVAAACTRAATLWCATLSSRGTRLVPRVAGSTTGSGTTAVISPGSCCWN